MPAVVDAEFHGHANSIEVGRLEINIDARMMRRCKQVVCDLQHLIVRSKNLVAHSKVNADTLSNIIGALNEAACVEYKAKPAHSSNVGLYVCRATFIAI